jgi:hypothetical protein
VKHLFLKTSNLGRRKECNSPRASHVLASIGRPP